MKKTSNNYRKALDKVDQGLASAIRNLHGAIMYSDGVSIQDLQKVEGMIEDINVQRISLIGITPDEPPPEDSAESVVTTPSTVNPELGFGHKDKKDASQPKTE